VSKNLPDPYKAYEFVMEHRKKLGIEWTYYIARKSTTQ
jgi:hypothetical protein